MYLRPTVMKKNLSILMIAFIYLMVSSGIYISMHYCGGKFRSFSLIYSHADGGCCCGSKEKNKNCCKDKTLYIKVKDTHKSVDLLKAPDSYEKLIFTGLSVLDLNYSLVISNTKFPYYYHKRPPPTTSSTPLYLNNRALII